MLDVPTDSTEVDEMRTAAPLSRSRRSFSLL